LGHCWRTGSNSRNAMETRNPLRHWSERVFSVGLTGFEPATT
jgi:hypothetical protein